MRTFLVNSERSSMAGIGGSPVLHDSGSIAKSSETLDLEAFTRCAPILLSDDEPQIIRLYEALMSRVQLHTVSVPDGMAALEYVRHKPVSLVISDMLKPSISGLDMLKALRQDSSTADVPFIMITATPEYESRMAFGALGGNAYLTKPINTRQFTQIVNQLLLAQLVEQTTQ